MIAASSLLLPRRANASIRMISLAFNSQQQNPQQLAADEFRQKLMGMAGKHFVVDARAGNSLGSENIILAAAQSGAVDVAVISGGVVSATVPEMSVFDIPFLFRDSAHAKAVAQGPLGTAIAAKFADKKLTLLAFGKQGFRNITNSKHPIRSPADVKGLKIRVIPNETYKMTFKALGAEVVPMEFPLVYAALKDGRLDGQENPVATIAASRFYEVQKYVSNTGHFFDFISVVANKKKFEALPADQQKILRTAMTNAIAWQRGVSVKADADALVELQKKGMTYTEMPASERAAMKAATAHIVDDVKKRIGAPFVDQVLAEVKKAGG